MLLTPSLALRKAHKIHSLNTACTYMTTLQPEVIKAKYQYRLTSVFNKAQTSAEQSLLEFRKLYNEFLDDRPPLLLDYFHTCLPAYQQDILWSLVCSVVSDRNVTSEARSLVKWGKEFKPRDRHHLHLCDWVGLFAWHKTGRSRDLTQRLTAAFLQLDRHDVIGKMMEVAQVRQDYQDKVWRPKDCVTAVQQLRPNLRWKDKAFVDCQTASAAMKVQNADDNAAVSASARGSVKGSNDRLLAVEDRSDRNSAPPSPASTSTTINISHQRLIAGSPSKTPRLDRKHVWQEGDVQSNGISEADVNDIGRSGQRSTTGDE